MRGLALVLIGVGVILALVGYRDRIEAFLKALR